MTTKPEVQAHVREYMQTHHLSERQMAALVGLTQPTLGRMLDPLMTYRGTLESWQALCRFGPLGLDEATVLAAVGLAPHARATGADPWADYVRALNRLPLTPRHRGHLLFQTEILVRDSQRPEALPNGAPPH